MCSTFARLIRSAGIALLSLVLVTATHAQEAPTDQGVYVLDGSASFRSQGGDLYGADDDRQTTVSFQPAGLYLIAPNVAVGGELRISRSSQDAGNTTTLGLGPSATYYLGEPEAPVLPFVGANLLLLRSTSSTDLGTIDIGGPVDLGTAEVTLTGLAFDIQAGFTYMLARNVGVTTAAFFLYERLGSDDAEAQTGNTVGVQVGITAFIF